MIFRPWKQLKQYKQLTDLLNKRIDQIKQIDQLHQDHIAALTQRLEQETKLTTLWKDIADRLKKEADTPLKMPLPDVSAVESLVSAFFEHESVAVAQEAAELTRNYGVMSGEDVRATKITLMKLWRTYAMRKLEQAAKQDVL